MSSTEPLGYAIESNMLQVTEVDAGSQAFNSGMQIGDRVVAVNGNKPTNARTYASMVQQGMSAAPAIRLLLVPLQSQPAVDRAKRLASTPLPIGWEVRRTPEGRRYFVNHVSRSTQWDLPKVSERGVTRGWLPGYQRVPSASDDWKRMRPCAS